MATLHLTPPNALILIGKFLAATKQLLEHFFLSVRPSVHLSVWLSVCLSVTPFSLCSCHRIIMKSSEVITMTKVISMYEVKVWGKNPTKPFP